MKQIKARLNPKEEKDANVRLRVALALAAARQKEAVPVLISLIKEMASDQSGPAEDFLVRLAGESPPKDLPDSSDDKNREQRAAAWQKWWDDVESKIVMPSDRYTELRARFIGNVLLIQANNNQIVEVDRNNKVLMTITGLSNPWDAQILPGNKVLIAEYNGYRVTERDFKGNILWKKDNLGFYPIQVQRLPNGDTFIVGQNKIIQVNRAGKEVLTLTRQNYDVRTAKRLPNGQIVIITNRSQYERLDRQGKTIKTVTLPTNVPYYQNEILDNGNVLVPLGWNNKIVEYNSEGKEVWSVANVEQPLHVFRLPNKGFLASSQNWPYKFVEHDKAGKKVREHVTNIYVFRVKAR